MNKVNSPTCGFLKCSAENTDLSVILATIKSFLLRVLALPILRASLDGESQSICEKCLVKNSMIVMRTLRNDYMPSDGDTTDWLYQEWRCPKDWKHTETVEGSGHYAQT